MRIARRGGGATMRIDRRGGGAGVGIEVLGVGVLGRVHDGGGDHLVLHTVVVQSSAAAQTAPGRDGRCLEWLPPPPMEDWKCDGACE
mmetsp:Transcript_7848/g.13666  ORF Transcript_7848/g.13666 Transcript_7848/m.13666 type:complete len:87 (-) Transcript_7848:121-381(-)